MAMEWQRSGFDVVTRKIAGKKHIEDRRMIGHSQVNNSVIIRISYVYVTYMLRICYVIDSGKIKVSPYFHIKKMCRYYEYGRSYLPCTVLPCSHTAA